MCLQQMLKVRTNVKSWQYVLHLWIGNSKRPVTKMRAFNLAVLCAVWNL